MKLSEAIAKRQQALEKAEAMDRWAKEQAYGNGQLKWYEIKVAINKVVEKAFDEYHKYNDAIENDIQLMTIEIPKEE